MPKKTAYLTTGQFAKLVGVSKHTLFFYDDKELFSPSKVKDNGYRYYSLKQVETFSVISALKDIGMPLDDIRTYLKNRSPEQFVELLDKEADKLQTKINDLKKLHSAMEEKRTITSKTLSHNLNVYTIENNASRLLYLTEVSDVLDTKSYYQSYQSHYSNFEQKTQRTSWLEGLMVPTTEITDDFSGYKGYIYSEVKDKQYSNCKLDGGPYLVKYIKGNDDAVLNGYMALKQHAVKNGYSIGAYFFEDLVLDELSFKDYDQYVYKLSMQIDVS